jgi:hypothetical protein
MAELPARGPALAGKRMLLAFDIDCGEIVVGHRFIARGLADCGTIETDEFSAPGFSLEYELVPGVQPLNDPQNMFNYIVHVTYEADVALPWQAADGGAIAPFDGGATTHGSLGDWPLPSGARGLRFKLSGPHRRQPGGGLKRSPVEGLLEVDLVAGSARWTEHPTIAGA